jgi:hypothetical protein
LAPKALDLDITQELWIIKTGVMWSFLMLGMSLSYLVFDLRDEKEG